MKFHVTMLRSAELMKIICQQFSPDGYQVQILKARTHHRKGSAFMTVTFEGPDNVLTAHAESLINLVTGVERLIRDDYVEPEPPDFKRCQNEIIVTPFSSDALIGRCPLPPVWIARNKPLDKRKRVALCESCKNQVKMLLPNTTFIKI